MRGLRPPCNPAVQVFCKDTCDLCPPAGPADQPFDNDEPAEDRNEFGGKAMGSKGKQGGVGLQGSGSKGKQGGSNNEGGAKGERTADLPRSSHRGLAISRLRLKPECKYPFLLFCKIGLFVNRLPRVLTSTRTPPPRKDVKVLGADAPEYRGLHTRRGMGRCHRRRRWGSRRGHVRSQEGNLGLCPPPHRLSSQFDLGVGIAGR